MKDDDDNAVFNRIMRNGKWLGDCQVGKLREMAKQAAKGAERNLRKARRVEKGFQAFLSKLPADLREQLRAEFDAAYNKRWQKHWAYDGPAPEDGPSSGLSDFIEVFRRLPILPIFRPIARSVVRFGGLDAATARAWWWRSLDLS